VGAVGIENNNAGDFKDFRRNAKEHQVIEKEWQGTQRNSYCSLKAPPFVPPINSLLE
jgi:hypothetical protein